MVSWSVSNWITSKNFSKAHARAKISFSQQSSVVSKQKPLWPFVLVLLEENSAHSICKGIGTHLSPVGEIDSSYQVQPETENQELNCLTLPWHKWVEPRVSNTVESMGLTQVTENQKSN